MALERRTPLPAGTYWVDLPNAKLPGFLAWRLANKPTVRVLKTNQDDEGFSWLLFQVASPTPWLDARVFGFPTIADKGSKTDKPVAFEPAKDIADQIADALPSPVQFTGLLWLVALGFGVYTAAQFVKQHSSKG